MRGSHWLASVPPLPYAVALLAAIGAHRRFPLRLPAAVARPLGGLLLMMGVALDAWSLATHLRGGTSPMPSERARTLVSTGPYGRSRNPIYIAHTLVTVGTGLVVARSAWAPLAGAAGLAAVDRWVVPVEEHELSEAFGEAYERYCEQVPRWL